jgi:hypothetical protein
MSNYIASGKEREVLLPVPGNRESVRWYRVQEVCWHVNEGEEEYGAQLIGFWVVGGGLRRASAVVAGR